MLHALFLSAIIINTKSVRSSAAKGGIARPSKTRVPLRKKVASGRAQLPEEDVLNCRTAPGCGVFKSILIHCNHCYKEPPLDILSVSTLKDQGMWLLKKIRWWWLGPAGEHQSVQEQGWIICTVWNQGQSNPCEPLLQVSHVQWHEVQCRVSTVKLSFTHCQNLYCLLLIHRTRMSLTAGPAIVLFTTIMNEWMNNENAFVILLLVI